LLVNWAARFTGLADAVAVRATKLTNAAVFILVIDAVLRRSRYRCFVSALHSGKNAI
jgi:hypothetical protein